jgi:hypothetical protein
MISLRRRRLVRQLEVHWWPIIAAILTSAYGTQRGQGTACQGVFIWSCLSSTVTGLTARQYGGTDFPDWREFDTKVAKE